MNVLLPLESLWKLSNSLCETTDPAYHSIRTQTGKKTKTPNHIDLGYINQFLKQTWERFLIYDSDFNLPKLFYS